VHKLHCSKPLTDSWWQIGCQSNGALLVASPIWQDFTDTNSDVEYCKREVFIQSCSLGSELVQEMPAQLKTRAAKW